MDIHDVWKVVFKIFRKRRFRVFLEVHKPSTGSRILDIGGYPGTWLGQEIRVKQINIVNVHEIAPPADLAGHDFVFSIADGCHLPYGDREFDIGFSNSVIEHVGDGNRQRQFASEMRRVARDLWVQTPAYGFWIEPHFLTPFIHWLPRAARLKLARNFTVWGWMTRPGPQEVQRMVDDIRLLSLREMKELFPDCTILKEKFLFIFTKSYVAVRTGPGPAPLRHD